MAGPWELLAAVLIPFLGAVVLRLWPRELPSRALGTLGAALSVAALVLLLPFFLAAVDGTPAALVQPWIPTLGVDLALRVDGLAALFALLVAGVGAVVFAYSAGYMEAEEDAPQSRTNAFFAYLLAFEGSMLGVVLADDVLLLFLFWELTSLTSFLLIGYHRDDPDAVYGARKAMILTVTGGITMFAGLLGLAMLGGTFRISGLIAAAPALVGHPLLPVTMGLVVAGAAAKAAQFPLHIWLPNAMVAPTPVSAYLHSAAMVKAGIYLLARVRPAYAPLVEWQVLVTALGLTTMLLTAVLALGQRDPKRLLAYSTCSQLGLIVAALGLPVLSATAGAVLHVAHHAVFKAGLFLAAGVAIHAFHAKTMDGMGGLAKVLPVTAAATLFLALASAGVPFFSGFISKELVLEAAIEAALHGHGSAAFGGWAVVAVLAAASAFTVAYSLVFFQRIFLGEAPRSDAGAAADGAPGDDDAPHLPEAPGLWTRAPVLLLGGLALAAGVVPGLWDGLAGAAQAGTLPSALAAGAPDVHLALWHGLTPGLLVTALVLVAGLALTRLHPRAIAFAARLESPDVRATADHLYHALLDACQRSALSVARTVQRETPQTYVAYTVVGAAALAAGGLVLAGVPLPVPTLDAGPLVLLVVGLIAAAVLTVTQATGYTLGVVALGAAGLLIGLLYLLLGAPDVGLTQLLVETLLLALFVAILSRLPPVYAEPARGRRIRDAALAAFVGATAFVLVLVATGPAAFPPVGPRYLDPALLVEQAGGHNAVNVILVDFRALDTLGEITVVAIAGLAGVALVQSRVRGWLA